MAKVKNKRNSGLADKVNNKRKTVINKQKLNPFEVHINKEKIKVLGKKSKHERGLPGVSRAKAIQKRKETLGTEMKLMNKTNTFIDRRIGEKNTQLSAEDRMVARFAAERAKQHNKKSIYNLADDEVLTHRGQTLEQIEKFDDPRSDDEEDGEAKKFGGLDDDFVSEGHFGGGMLSRTDSKDGAKSHKDLIEQLIAESKKRKAEKQKEKEQTLDLTEKLDSEWKDLQPVVFKKMRKEEKEESAIEKLLSQAEKKNMDYDKMMRELKFEKRGTPSDGLKNTEKLAKEEREKLEQLERERDMRMIGEEEIIVKPKQPARQHRSAEDLDDNFELDDEKEFMLAYDKDGKPLVPENVLKNFTVPNAKPKFDDGVSDTSDDEEDDNEKSENDSEGETKQAKDLNKKETKDSDELENSDDNDSSESDSEEETKKTEDSNKTTTVSSNKLEKNDDDSSENSEEHIKNNTINNKTSNSKPIANDSVIRNAEKSKNDTILFQHNESCDEKSDESDDNGNDENEEVDDEEHDGNDLNDLNDLESEAESENEIPDDVQKFGVAFDLEENEGEKLKELLTGKSPSQQSSALKSLIKSYDPSLSEKNKDKLTKLFAYMLQYINDIFTDLKEESDIIKAFLIFDKLAPHFYDLAHTNKVSTKKYVAQLLKEKHDNFKKRHRIVPNMDTLIFFKLISLLYPTSDFKHPITTPALTFMTEILTLCRFNNAYSISRGLFITTLILEYTTLSKRLVPAAINFLRGILYLSANTCVLNPIQVVPPFRLHKDTKILNLESDCSRMDAGNKMVAKDLILDQVNDEFKIRCFIISMEVVKEFFDYFNDLEAQQYLFEPHLLLVNRVDLELYPKKVGKRVLEIVQYMKSCLEVKTFTPLCPEKKRPKALRLYEPDIQEVFTGSKSSKLSREQAESQRLKSKYKKEMKGALREIRRDKAYIASVKIRQKIHSDNMRKEKVKQIYKDASIQQGELNKMKRMK